MNGFDDGLMHDPHARLALAHARMTELAAEAANERAARALASAGRTAARSGLRTRLGLWLVRLGAALAQEREETVLQR